MPLSWKIERDEDGLPLRMVSDPGPRVSRAVYEAAVRAHKLLKLLPDAEDDLQIEDPD